MKTLIKSFIFFFLFLFSSSLSYWTWVQEDSSISGRTTLEAKTELLKDITTSEVISSTKIDYNRTELRKIFNSWEIWSFLKDSYLEAIWNNLLYSNIWGILKETNFWYKIIDWVKIISLDSDFLLELQKNVNWTYKDITRTDIEAKQIVSDIQLFFNWISTPTDWDVSVYPKSFIKNHYAITIVWKGNWTSMNSVFEQICKKYEEKTICIEWMNWELIAYWLRDTINNKVANQQEYEELISKYEVDWKTQLPTELRSKLEWMCPITDSRSLSWFIENNALDECWLVWHDFDCDWKNEWIDYNKFDKTTTVYALNTVWSWIGATIQVKVILYLNWKEIVKFYVNKNWCYSNILTKELDDTSSYKIIAQWFWWWVDAWTDFILNDITENWITLTDWSITSKPQLLNEYKFYSSPKIYISPDIKNNYRIDLDLKDTNTGTQKVLWNLNYSISDNIADKTLTVNLNQDVLWVTEDVWKVELQSTENWITNKNLSHYTLTQKDWLFHYYYNWKELFQIDINNSTLVPLNNSVIDKEENLSTFTLSDFELKDKILFSSQYYSWTEYSKLYSDLYISKPDTSKLYFYKLNQKEGVTNFYLWQIIDTTSYVYNLFWAWTSWDNICKSFVWKDWTFFDNNRTLNDFDSSASSYIWFNAWNWCNFRAQNISFYTDVDWKLSYLKKIKLNWTYNSSLELFEFVQSEDNSLQWIDFWTILDSSLSNCVINQVINNELDSCSEMKPLDIDWDWWNEWVLSKAWEFEIYNNIISENSLGELIPKLELILKSNWDSYCNTAVQDIEYYKYWSEDPNKVCMSDTDVQAKITDTGLGTSEICQVDSSIILNSIDNYQFVYWITWTSTETKKYTRTQIISEGDISCD